MFLLTFSKPGMQSKPVLRLTRVAAGFWVGNQAPETWHRTLLRSSLFTYVPVWWLKKWENFSSHGCHRKAYPAGMRYWWHPFRSLDPDMPEWNQILSAAHVFWAWGKAPVGPCGRNAIAGRLASWRRLWLWSWWPPWGKLIERKFKWSTCNHACFARLRCIFYPRGCSHSLVEVFPDFGGRWSVWILALLCFSCGATSGMACPCYLPGLLWACHSRKLQAPVLVPDGERLGFDFVIVCDRIFFWGGAVQRLHL